MHGEPKEGNIVTLVEPEEEQIVQMMCVEVKAETMVLGLESRGWRLAEEISLRISLREVPKESILSGFPCVTVVPSVPLRLLKLAIAGRSLNAKGIWPDPLPPDDVRVELIGISIEDEEIEVWRIMEIVKTSGANVEVYLGRGCSETRIPWVPSVGE